VRAAWCFVQQGLGASSTCDTQFVGEGGKWFRAETAHKHGTLSTPIPKRVQMHSHLVWVCVHTAWPLRKDWQHNHPQSCCIPRSNRHLMSHHFHCLHLNATSYGIWLVCMAPKFSHSNNMVWRLCKHGSPYFQYCMHSEALHSWSVRVSCHSCGSGFSRLNSSLVHLPSFIFTLHIGFHLHSTRGLQGKA